MANKQKLGRPSGARRTALVLAVVRTDNTFELTKLNDGTELWVGRCIHCNRKLVVGQLGQTGATLEHIVPLSADGSPDDVRNLALACASCNNEKGIDHDPNVGRGGRSDEVIAALQEKRAKRWRGEA